MLPATAKDKALPFAWESLTFSLQRNVITASNPALSQKSGWGTPQETSRFTPGGHILATLTLQRQYGIFQS